MADNNGGFWSSLGASLGQGLRTAGGILDPTVANQLENEYTQKMAYQNRQKEMLMGNIISGIQNGSIAKEQGAVALQRMGIDPSVIGAIGPTPEAQANQQFMKWMQGQQQPQAIPQPQTPGMAPPAMAPAQQPQMIGGIPASAAMSPLGRQFLAATKPQEHYDPNSGNLIRTYPGGQTEVVPVTPGKRPMRTIISGQNEVQQELDPKTGEWKEIGRGPRFAKQVAPVVNIGGSGQISPDDRHSTAEMIANYDLAPPSRYSMGKPENVKLMSDVKKINPDYDARLFSSSQRALGAFAAGVEGRAVKSFNVAVDHLETLKEAGDALKNNDLKAFNKVSNIIAEEFGKSAPTNFDAVKGIVADELTKAILGSQGALGDREQMVNNLSRAKSPEQLNDVIKQYQKLMVGQLKGLEKQYESSTYRKDFKNKLLPKSREILDSMTPSKPAAAPQQGIPDGWTVKVK